MADKFSVFSVVGTIDNVTSYCVSDAESNDDANERPDAAIFPVSMLYDAATQRRRAFKFCAYLNSLAEVMNDLEKDQQI